MLLFLFFVILLPEYIINVNSLTVGKINNVALYLPVYSSRALTINGTCEQCLCDIITNSSSLNSISSIGIGSFNCFINNKTCQFFSNATFYEYWLGTDNNTVFYFIQLPTILSTSDLVAWHTFDNGSYNDSSGNGLNAYQVVDVSFVPGRINQAVFFYSTSSYYEIGGFTQLGENNMPYTVAFWVQPLNLGEAPLVHMSIQSTGGAQNTAVSGWCIDIFGFLNNGQVVTRCWAGSAVIVNGYILPLNVWTHLTATYSQSVGLLLYINGTLFDQSSPFSYSASGGSNYLTLANNLVAQTVGGCAPNMYALNGTFYGYIDEFRVYSTALSANDIYALGNP